MCQTGCFLSYLVLGPAKHQTKNNNTLLTYSKCANSKCKHATNGLDIWRPKFSPAPFGFPGVLSDKYVFPIALCFYTPTLLERQILWQANLEWQWGLVSSDQCGGVASLGKLCKNSGRDRFLKQGKHCFYYLRGKEMKRLYLKTNTVLIYIYISWYKASK